MWSHFVNCKALSRALSGTITGSEDLGFLFFLLGDFLSGFSRDLLDFLMPWAPSAPPFTQVLKCEVELMARMAKTIDGFTQNQTRLVVIIDGLDACEQDKVLQMLDTVRLYHLETCSCHIHGSWEERLHEYIKWNLNSTFRFVKIVHFLNVET